MAKRARTTRQIEGSFHGLVAELVDARLQRVDGVDGLLRLLQALQRRVDSLERRLARIGSGGRSGKRSGKRPGRPPLHEACLVEGCGAEHYALGLCSRHYQQWRRGRRDLQEIVDRAKAGAKKKAATKTTAKETTGKGARKKAATKTTAKKTTGKGARKKAAARRGGETSRGASRKASRKSRKKTAR